MVSLPFSTRSRLQNICQPAQASDNFNSFRHLEDFDHKTMKQGWEKITLKWEFFCS